MNRRTLTALALSLTVCLSSAPPPPARAAAADAEPLTPAALARALAADPRGAEASALADRVRQWFGKANLPKGPNPKVDGTFVAFAVETPGKPRLVSEDGVFSAELARLGDTDVYATALNLPDGFATRWAFEVDGTPLPHPAPNPAAGKAKGQAKGKGKGQAKGKGKGQGPPQTWAQLEVYAEHPDSRERSDVPKGKVLDMPRFSSKVFPGTTRDWWVYVPAQAGPDRPSAVMVFQDGAGPRAYVPTVFDNLIARKEMPVTVAVFVQPGVLEGGRPNRSFEYDTLSDQYARFLLDEILPAAETEAHVTLRRDAAGRAIAGSSSGGICAWTVAWERPDAFSKVLSWVGSFTNIASGESGRAGGHNYEAMIRKTDRKPIRVFLQDGANDLDNANGNWPLANQQMARSLAYKGYDYKFVYGQGFHSGLHGRALLPDSLRWLWRGWESELPK